MKKKAHIDIYEGFQSLKEMLDWLKTDVKKRNIKYEGDKELGVFFSWNEKTHKHDLIGSNVDTFAILDRWFDDEPEINSLEDYFDENDSPIEDKFAEDFDLSKFVGEEIVEENN